ncbi:MAG: 4-(cytidine 5'-diphospho)-2-C-methyl-D-erythritol kinase [Culicoidibacterales bacterium]
MEIVKKAYAKINLVLDIRGLKEDGMHEVDMIMTSLALHDTLFFKLVATQAISLEAEGFSGAVEDNLIYKAAKLIQRQWHIKEGVEIKLVKRIPVEAGLAGGSSDCAATIKALIELWKIKATAKEINELAVKLGADVPYCLENKTARVSGIGEKVRLITPVMPIYVILCKPNYGISTKDAYKSVDDYPYIHYDCELMEQAIASSDYQQIIEMLGNSFEQITYKGHADLAKHSQELKAYADGTLLCGSGPTLFALTRDIKKVEKMLEFCKNKPFLTIATETI